MKINTGRGTIPLITLVGIWSVSALTSLPGLAVSPILGQLTTIFPLQDMKEILILSMPHSRDSARAKARARFTSPFAVTIFLLYAICSTTA